MEYDSAMKWNGVVIHATIWMNIENILSGKKNRQERPQIVWFHLYEISKIGRSIEMKRDWWLPEARWRGKWE